MRISHVHVMIHLILIPQIKIYEKEKGKKKCICCKLFIVKLQRRERCFNEFICMEMHYSGAFWCS